VQVVPEGDGADLKINHPLGLENKILGYVYLVDPNLKIRWAGNAMATEEEAGNLRRATAVLMKRIQQ
jgi:ATPase complex subunit ATP10